ncbi:MAG: phage minor head protein [Propionicimonas sp.]
MAVTDDTLAALARLRALLDGATDTVQADLVRMWAVAWDEIVDEWRQIVAELADQNVTAAQRRVLIVQSERIRKALETAAVKLDELGRQAGTRIVLDLPGVLGSQDELLGHIVRTQLPAAIDPSLSRMSAPQLEWIVQRATGQIESRLRPLSGDVVAVMRAELIRGVAAGSNPRQVASHMLRRVAAGFDGGRARATLIARTEMLDATRAAALASRQANRDVLAGWRWTCALGARTCPSCLAMHGRLFDVDDPGPDDHPNGRCTSTPVTKSWSDLGITGMGREPESVFPDARAWFDRQPRDTQLAIMGPRRLADLNAGRITWDQIPTSRSSRTCGSTSAPPSTRSSRSTPGPVPAASQWRGSSSRTPATPSTSSLSLDAAAV